MFDLDTDVNSDTELRNFLASTDGVAWLREFYNYSVSETPALQITSTGDEATACELLQSDEVYCADSSQAAVKSQPYTRDDLRFQQASELELAILEGEYEKMTLMQLLSSYVSSIDRTKSVEYPAAEENIRKLFDIMNTPEKRMPSPNSVSKAPGCEHEQCSDLAANGNKGPNADFVIRISNIGLIDQLLTVVQALSDFAGKSSDTLSSDTLDKISKLRIALLISDWSVDYMTDGLKKLNLDLVFYSHISFQGFMSLLNVCAFTKNKMIEPNMGIIISKSDKFINLILSNTFSQSTRPKSLLESDYKKFAANNLLKSLFAAAKEKYTQSDVRRFGGPWIFFDVFSNLIASVDSGIKEEVRNALKNKVSTLRKCATHMSYLIYGRGADESLILLMLENSNKSLEYLKKLIYPNDPLSLETSLAITRHKDKENKSVFAISESESSYYNFKLKIQEYLKLVGNCIFATDIDKTLIGETPLAPESLIAYLQSQGIKTILIISNCLFDRVPELELEGYVAALNKAGIKWFHFPLGFHHSKAVFLNSFRDMIEKSFEVKRALSWKLIDDKVMPLSFDLLVQDTVTLQPRQELINQLYRIGPKVKVERKSYEHVLLSISLDREVYMLDKRSALLDTLPKAIKAKISDRDGRVTLSVLLSSELYSLYCEAALRENLERIGAVTADIINQDGTVELSILCSRKNHARYIGNNNALVTKSWLYINLKKYIKKYINTQEKFLAVYQIVYGQEDLSYKRQELKRLTNEINDLEEASEAFKLQLESEDVVEEVPVEMAAKERHEYQQALAKLDKCKSERARIKASISRKGFCARVCESVFSISPGHLIPASRVRSFNDWGTTDRFFNWLFSQNIPQEYSFAEICIDAMSTFMLNVKIGSVICSRELSRHQDILGPSFVAADVRLKKDRENILTALINQSVEFFEEKPFHDLCYAVNYTTAESQRPLDSLVEDVLRKRFGHILKNFYAAAKKIFEPSIARSSNLMASFSAKLLLSTYYFRVLYSAYTSEFLNVDEVPIREYLHSWFSLYSNGSTAISVEVIEKIIDFHRRFLLSMGLDYQMMTHKSVFEAIKTSEFDFNVLQHAINMVIYRTPDNKPGPYLASDNIENLVGLRKQEGGSDNELAITFSDGVFWFSYSRYNFSNVVRDFQSQAHSDIRSPVLYIFLDVDDTCIPDSSGLTDHLIVPRLLQEKITKLQNKGHVVHVCFISNCLPVRDLQNMLLGHFNSLDEKEIPYSHCALGWRCSKVDFIRSLSQYNVDFTQGLVFLFDDKVAIDLYSCFPSNVTMNLFPDFKCSIDDHNTRRAIDDIENFSALFPSFSSRDYIAEIKHYVREVSLNNFYKFPLASNPIFLFAFATWLKSFIATSISKQINGKDFSWSLTYCSPGFFTTCFDNIIKNEFSRKPNEAQDEVPQSSLNLPEIFKSVEESVQQKEAPESSGDMLDEEGLHPGSVVPVQPGALMDPRCW
jgi:hypothetical protein